MSFKIFINACEASGDLHGAHLIEELSKLDSSLDFKGFGGPQMQAKGVELIEDMTKISALGLGDVLKQYFKYRKIFNNGIEELKKWKPNVLILMDSPAFNLRFAKKIRQEFPDLPIVYYICPQIWAWGHQRIHTVKKYISKMFSILPFEVEFYTKAGIQCEFVGHPLLDHPEPSEPRDSLRRKLGLSSNSKAIGILPGSRKSEVERILPIMLKAANLLHRQMPETTFHLACAKNIPKDVYHRITKDTNLLIHEFNEDFSKHVAALDFALVTSGTATLQTALAGTPFFLLYKASLSTYFLGKQLIKVPYLGIVNLLAGKSVIPEFIQWDANPKTIAHEAKVLLSSPKLCEQMREEFKIIRNHLGSRGASATTAKGILNFLKQEASPKETPAKESAHS